VSREYHQLRNVKRERNGSWGGECACSRWYGNGPTQAAVRKAWEAHTKEKGAK
jgi:hypothetical protein